MYRIVIRFHVILQTWVYVQLDVNLFLPKHHLPQTDIKVKTSCCVFAKYISYLQKQIPSTELLDMLYMLLEWSVWDIKQQTDSLTGHNSLVLFIRHVLFAESSVNTYAGSSFPGLADGMFEIEGSPDEARRWEIVRKHFSVILYTIESAASTLRDVHKFMPL